MNKAVKIALDITAYYHYVYDPNHNDKPPVECKMTKSGWSWNDDVPDAPSQQVEMPSDKNPQIPEDQRQNSNPSTEEEQTQLQTQQPVEQEQDQGLNVEEQDENLFDNEQDESGFVTDEKGKQEEQQQEGEGEPAAPQQEGEGEGLQLDLENGGAAQGEAENTLFDEDHKGMYLDPDKYNEYIERMNAFIQQFDEGEGKENQVTFKAIAANLNWSSLEDVQAFQKHCDEKGIGGAGDVIAFLYFQHEDNEEKFDQILAEMP